MDSQSQSTMSEVTVAPVETVSSVSGSSSDSATASAKRSWTGGSSSNTNKKRSDLTLDLKPSSTSGAQLLAIPSSQSQSQSQSGTTGSGAELKTSPGFLLTSPDVQMLQLASPDLEKFIIQGLMGQNTPTPTQIVFPKNVTEEQESYAKGFVDALNALHRTGMSGMAYNVVNPNGANVAFQMNQVNGQNFIPQIFALPPNQSLQPVQMQMQFQPPSSVQYQLAPQQHYTLATHQHQQPVAAVKQEPYSPSLSPAPSEPQTVPSERGSVRSTNSSSASNNGTSPINMEDQSKMKVERKRERNRVAAAKCRMRKLERIAQLEERVAELKQQNSQLSDNATSLRNELTSLKQELLMHVSSGCSIEMSHNLLHSLQQSMHS